MFVLLVFYSNMTDSAVEHRDSFLVKADDVPALV